MFVCLLTISAFERASPEVSVSDWAAGAMAIREKQLHLRGAELGGDLLGHQGLQTVLPTQQWHSQGQ